jgi:glucose dehydrogenase
MAVARSLRVTTWEKRRTTRATITSTIKTMLNSLVKSERMEMEVRVTAQEQCNKIHPPIEVELTVGSGHWVTASKLLFQGPPQGIIMGSLSIKRYHPRSTHI